MLNMLNYDTIAMSPSAELFLLGDTSKESIKNCYKTLDDAVAVARAKWGLK